MLRKILIVIFLIHHGEFTTIRKRNTNFRSQHEFHTSYAYIDSRSSHTVQDTIVLQPQIQFPSISHSNQNYQPLIYSTQKTPFQTNFDHTSQEESKLYQQNFNGPTVQVEISREKINQLNQDRRDTYIAQDKQTPDQPKYDDFENKQKADEITQSYQEAEGDKGIHKFTGITQVLNPQNNLAPNVHDYHVPDNNRISIPNMPENIDIVFPPPLIYDENVSSTTRASILDIIKMKKSNKSTTENVESYT